ncbi:MAG: hypothetical protein QM784_21320 [Polyangiaceae bacterium]
MMTQQVSNGHFGFNRSRWRSTLSIAGSVLLGGVFWAAWSRSEPRSASDAAPASAMHVSIQTPIAVEPRRADHEPRVDSPLPVVPAQYESLRPVSLRLETTIEENGRVLHQRKRVMRTSQFVSVKPEGVAHEWWFARNQRDPRRVSGILVEHQRRAIVEYDESELRTLGIARGWLDVVSLGMGADALNGLTDTGETQMALGLDFREWSEKSGTQAPRNFVLWNGTESLPLRTRSRTQAGFIEQRLLEVRFDVDTSQLREPRERFPEYRVMDVADFREKHHESEEGHEHSGMPAAN